MIKNENIININNYLLKFKLINIFQYLIIIIICFINIYVTYNIKINRDYNFNIKNNKIFRKFNDYIIACERKKLINFLKYILKILILI